MNAEDPTSIELPAHAPVMVLPNALLFPGALLPLYIFEPRYRAMLTWALEHDRTFCLALLKRGLTEWHTADDFHHIAGIGVIRACVTRDDGTSHLVLQGITRVEFTDFLLEQPFVIARIRKLPQRSANPTEASNLMALVLELCAEWHSKGVGIPDALDQQLAQVSDAGVLSDLVAHTFVRDPYRRQSILAQADITARLRTLIRHLREEMPGDDPNPDPDA